MIFYKFLWFLGHDPHQVKGSSYPFISIPQTSAVKIDTYLGGNKAHNDRI